MKILAIETSTDACSCAILSHGEIYEQFKIAPRAHGELILAMVKAALAEAELTLNMLDGLAFGCGPGAFTGLRIAAGVIQGLAFSAELPVVPISSLAALSQTVTINAQPAQHILTIQDARMGEVYYGAFQRGADLMVTALINDKVCHPQQVIPPLENRSWAVVGGGWNTYRTIIENNLINYEIVVLPEYCYPHAAAVAQLALTKLQNGQIVAAAQALPVYLRQEM